MIAEHLRSAGYLENGGSPAQAGMQIYPPCGGSLASGDISSILVGSSSYDSDSWYAVRDALAGGDRNNWEQLGGLEIFNGDTWPGTFTNCLRTIVRLERVKLVISSRQKVLVSLQVMVFHLNSKYQFHVRNDFKWRSRLFISSGSHFKRHPGQVRLQ